jgi:hypothetical protein
MAAAILTLLVAGGVTLALSGHLASHRPSRGGAPGSGSAGNGHTGLTAAAAMQMAATWVGQQISRSVIVACDPVMCSALQAQGFPAANLLVLRPSTASPRGAEVVVVTPAVRSQFGNRLDSMYAPSVMAGFGSGPNQVNVRVIAPDGAAAYLAALRQDVAARSVAGAQLLANKRIVITAQARMQLTAGQVDSRLLILLPAMAAAHPIQILAFGDPGPGASPGIPLCSAALSGSGRAAGMTDAGYLRWMAGFVQAQLVPFAGRVVIPRPGNKPVVQLEFSRPSPLGLLTHG